MAWPGLIFWTLALMLALPVARGARYAPLQGALAPLALIGLGLWLAYLVENTSEAIAWGAFGVGVAGALAALGALVLPDRAQRARTDLGGVLQWTGAGAGLVVLAVSATISVLAAVGVQSSGL